MPNSEKPNIGGIPATVDQKGRLWLNRDGRDSKMGRTRVIKDPKTGVTTQGDGIRETLEHLDQANELYKKVTNGNQGR